ncbi:MAG: BatA and WFA domain-containing protein [Thermoguttaceae bacterium]
MTFAAPLFLIAALAAAIPVVMHLVNRQRAKQLPFPTLRFLKISVQKTRRRKRVHDVLLMAIRAAVLLLIAAALAKPTVTTFGSLWGNAGTAAVIVLDNSMSMGTIDGDRPRFETAAAAAGQILDQLGEGDQAALLPTCGPSFPDAGRLARTQDPIRQMLGQCRVSYERADLTAKLQQARDLLAKSDAPNKHIYVLSDMQRIAWEGLGTSVPGEGRRRRAEGGGLGTSVPSPKADERRRGGDKETRRQGDGKKSGSPPSPLLPLSPSPRLPLSGPSPPVVLVNCNRSPKPNVAVQEVEIAAAIPVTGLPMKATATLLNTSTVAQQRVVELLIDGVRQAASPELNLPPLGQVKHEFAFTLNHGGLHRGEVQLVGDDGSKYDDRRFFALQVDQGIPVAVVKARRHEIPYLDDAYYLEKALVSGGGSGAIVATTLLANELTKQPLEKFKVLFCVNLPALDAQAADRLAAYVAGGGRVVWLCGDNVRPDAYNAMNQQAGGQLLPTALAEVRTPSPKGDRDSWHVGFLDKKHPALTRLVEPASLYESVLVYKHVRMSADGRAWVMARLDDAEPLLVQRNVGKGLVLMLGTSVQVNWSNLPLRTIFLPLVTQLTFDLADVEQTRGNVIAGQPLVCGAGVPPASAAGTAAPQDCIEVVPPGGGTLRLSATDKDGKAAKTFHYADTHEIGIYVLRQLGLTPPRQIAYSVNFDPDEAEPAEIEPAELEERLGGAPLIIAENPADLSATFARLREGKSLWSVFLTAVLIALVFETFLSNRFSPKQDDAEGTRSGRK